MRHRLLTHTPHTQAPQEFILIAQAQAPHTHTPEFILIQQAQAPHTHATHTSHNNL